MGRIYTLFSNLAKRVKRCLVGRGTMPSTANLNDYKDLGIWWVNALSTKTNLPNEGNYGFLEVIKSQSQDDTSLTLQRYSNYSSRNVWQRAFVNDQWSSWYYVGGYNFTVQEFTSSQISSYTGQNSGVQISYTVPTGYEYVTLLSTRTNGSIQLSYAESVNTSTKKIQCYYRCFSGASSAPAKFTITVSVLFRRIS